MLSSSRAHSQNSKRKQRNWRIHPQIGSSCELKSQFHTFATIYSCLFTSCGVSIFFHFHFLFVCMFFFCILFCLFVHFVFVSCFLLHVSAVVSFCFASWRRRHSCFGSDVFATFCVLSMCVHACVFSSMFCMFCFLHF